MRLVLPLALLLALAACKQDATAAPTPRPVVSEVVSPRSGLQPSYAGTVAARVETDLGFPINGTLAARPVEEGDVVAKGATLALLDPQDLDADVRAAEAGVTVAAAQLNSAQDAADRANQLVAKGVDSPATAEAAKSALAAATARQAQAQAALVQAKDLRSFATLTAPQDGVVTQVDAQPGAKLTAGQPVLRLAATGEREVVIDLSEQDVAGISPGATFRVRLEVAKEIASTATLRAIDPVSDRATRTRRLHLTLASDASPAFRLGALVQVETDARMEARLTVPATALINGGSDVWVVDRTTNTVHRTTLKLGPVTGERVLVLSGLTTGQEVVVKGVNSIQDGQAVGPRVAK
ncbi:MAG: efflux RND transporter periplasmic adaptor subunit [Rhodobacteraceae bacterium]|nr:efflux RND transporter periplasmic adaptor subunit [Paracoccaceae bacterium]